jgi:CO/xanthine dehydrogenase FAD-binding subunit
VSTRAVVIPRSVEEAVEVLRHDPNAMLLAGGTDLMVGVNAGTVQPRRVVSLARVPELRTWRVDGQELVLGAGVTYDELMHSALAELAPALSQAARGVGSPQIRNAGTVGGNLCTASPAGDLLPVLAALTAVVEVTGPDGSRSVPLPEFVVGVKRTTLGPGEIVTAVRVPVARGPQEFLKVGTRNAMVISVVSAVVVVDLHARTVRAGLGSVSPVPLRPLEAERLACSRVDWDRGVLADAAAEEFGALAARAATPIDDHRSSAAYRRHAVAVCATRALQRALS